jgi:pyridoxamine 5'-phosphate oxidase
MTVNIDDPIALFRSLYERASQECPQPDAMVLATVDPDGTPSARFVLLKGVDARGFVFYTNLNSRKARALDVNPRASLCFYWFPMGRQVRVEGPVERVTDDEADAYFATRPRDSQIGAWASDQSAPLASRAVLEQRVSDAAARFEGKAVTRPPFWSGFRVMPRAIEFWTADAARLHERDRFERVESGPWQRTLLYP